MLRTLKIFLLLPIFMVAACNRAPEEHEQQIYSFGTLVNIQVLGVDKQLANKAFDKLDHEFLRMHNQWHGWKPLGETFSINHNIATGKHVQPVSDYVAPLITRSKQIYHISDGLFNPAIGNLIGLWGFHQDTRPNGPPPSRASIKKFMQQHPGMDDLEIRDGKLISRNRAVNLDFGGFAKGYAMDIARAQLRKMGIKNSILNAGGDLCVAGSHGSRPWKVGIRHPQGRGIIASIEAADGECVLTSGNYERYLEYKGVHYAHILDPRTGYPVEGIVSVTVIDKDGGLADAAATALTVAGAKDWYRIAKQMGLKYVMLVADDGTVYVNPSMAKRINYEGHTPEHIVVSDPL
jgi:thiamine biosynthesis lipoprotein